MLCFFPAYVLPPAKGQQCPPGGSEMALLEQGFQVCQPDPSPNPLSVSPPNSHPSPRQTRAPGTPASLEVVVSGELGTSWLLVPVGQEGRGRSSCLCLLVPLSSETQFPIHKVGPGVAPRELLGGVHR